MFHSPIPNGLGPMTSVHDWQSYHYPALALLSDRATLLYWPCRELPTRVTYCKPDDSVKDHNPIAVISGTGFTGLFKFYVVSVYYHRSCRLDQGLVLTLASKEALFIKGLARPIPAVQFSQEVPGDHDHCLVARHLGFILFLMVDFSIEGLLLDQRQGNRLQYLAEQGAAFLGDLVLALKISALPCPKIEPSIAHELTPMVEVRKGAGLSQESGQVLVGDKLRGWRRHVGILRPQPVENLDHLGCNLLFPFGLVEKVGQQIEKMRLQDFDIPWRHFVQGRAGCVFPQAFERGGHDSRGSFLHSAGESLVAVGHDPIGVAAVFLNQGQAGVAIEKILLKGVVAEEFNQQLADPTPQAGDFDIAFIVNFVQFSEHQVLFADEAQADDFIQPAQGMDDLGVFPVGLVVVVGLDNPEFGNRLGIDIACEESEAPGSPEHTVLILPSGLADDAQRRSVVVNGNFEVVPKLFLDDSSPVPAGVGELLTVDFKEKAEGVFVNIHGDIDNIIQVDFLGSACNFHGGFSSLCVDSTGYERNTHIVHRHLQGEAFLLAA